MTAQTDRIEGKDSVGLYLAGLAKIPLLTAEEEIILAKRMEAGLYAERILGGLLEPDEANQQRLKATDAELAELVEAGQRARRRFISANLRLVVSVAKKYARGQLPFLDLIQEGNSGLIRAVEKFDYTKGFKFSTYATWWVRQAITRGIAQQSRVVRLPVHVAEQISQVLSARRLLEQRHDRQVEAEEIAQELGWETDQVLELLRFSQEHVSLDAPLDEESGVSLADLYIPQDDNAPDEMVFDAQAREGLEDMLHVLDERSADIVRRRYGLLDGRQAKLTDIADLWGISAERVRQLERAAIAAMRSNDRGKQLAAAL
ncbi:MAG: sigma-70 family RNA polymerase sigma factor [Propionibacteriaceae bacterium]|jgi:RNA polymerase sigma factor (sigma-70 family)|nr:sigma-70 family RNA polymerase sigma factor [Propionibacteriaceae bacterium]